MWKRDRSLSATRPALARVPSGSLPPPTPRNLPDGSPSGTQKMRRSAVLQLAPRTDIPVPKQPQPLGSHFTDLPRRLPVPHSAPQLQRTPKAVQAGGETSFPNPALVTAQSVSSQTQNESILHSRLTQNGSRSTERFTRGALWNPVAPVGTGDWERRKRGQEEEPESPGDHRTGPCCARASDSSRSGRPGSTGSGNRNAVTGGLARHPGSFRCSGQPKRQGMNTPQTAFPRKTCSLYPLKGPQ